MWVYIASEPGLWTVGFYTPAGKWIPEKDFTDPDKAAERVSWLNGNRPQPSKRQMVQVGVMIGGEE